MVKSKKREKGVTVDFGEIKDMEIVDDKSWYSEIVVWAVMFIGIISILYLNLFFKIAGLVSIILSFIILRAIYMKENKSKEEKNG